MSVIKFMSLSRTSLARQLSLSCTASEKVTLDVYGTKKQWIEPLELRIHVKQKRKQLWNNIFENRASFSLTLNKIRHTLIHAHPLKKLKEEYERSVDTWEQELLEKRLNLLGPDLAVAHFILNRGGAVRFWGQKEWKDKSYLGKLPTSYAPGYYIEALNASGTDLNYEGIQTLYNLKKLKWLSLRGLTRLDDFGLDIITGRYGTQLEHLDLTGCKMITHNGLASFYRFKNLKSLDMTGIEQTPELKMSCLMLYEVLPNLEFKGISLPLTRLIEDSARFRSISDDSEEKIQVVSK